MGKKYVIEGLADICPLCIEATDGRSKERRPPVFLVGCDGGYTGAVCAPHLAALIKASEGPVKPEAKQPETKAEPKPRVEAKPVQEGNGAPQAVPVQPK